MVVSTAIVHAHRRAFSYKKKTSEFRQWFADELERLGGRCPWCGVVMMIPVRNVTLHFHIDYLATVDHIIPIVEGGDNNYENLRVICANCNWLVEEKRRLQIDLLTTVTQRCTLELIIKEVL